MDFKVLFEKLKQKMKMAFVKQERNRSFDIAGKGEKSFLIRLSGNIESLNWKQAEVLKKCASILESEPILLGKKGRRELKDGVIYERYGVPTMNCQSFLDYVEGENVALAERGGAKVPLKNLKELRKEANLSRKDLADEVGVSKKMIRKYEKDSSPSLPVAIKLIDIFGDQVVKSLNFCQEPNKEVWLGKAPFEVAIRKDKTFLISFKSTQRRLKNLKNISYVFGSEPVVVGKKELEDVRVVRGIGELRG